MSQKMVAKQVSRYSGEILKDASTNQVSGIDVDTLNLWTCKNGHIIGILQTNCVIVLRVALSSYAKTVPENYPFAIVKEGTVVCGMCGDEKTYPQKSKKRFGKKKGIIN